MEVEVRHSKKAAAGEWQSPPLGEVFNPDRPRVAPSKSPKLPFIGMEHVEAHTMKLLGTVPAGTMKSSSVHFQPGDVLYGRLRPYLNKVYRPDFEGLCSAEFIVFPQTDGVDNRYLQYFLNANDFVTFASRLNEGDRPRVDFKQISSYPFPLPPLPEQRRIVEAIELQLGRLDAAVARLHAAKAKLKRYRQAVLKAAVEGRLFNSDLVEGELPEDWTWTTLGEALELVSGGTPKGLNESATGGIIPFFKVGDMTLDGNDRYMETSRTYLTPAEAKRLKLTIHPAGTVIFPKRGGAILTNKKRVLSEPGAFDLNLMGAIPNDEIDGGFLFYWFEHLDLSKIYDGSNIPQINKKNVDPLPFAKPPLKDQRRIAAELDRLLTSSNDTETTLDAQLQQAVRLRQAVLKRAFEGRLVGGVDPEIP